jgi:PGF-CTERM protein
LFEGLTDGGIAKKPAPADVPGCMNSTANNYNADATSDDGSCTFDTVEPEPEPEPEPVVEEEEDEVPGFGLLSAVAALSVVLILRRRL